MPLITVIIPAYNEVDSLPLLLDKVRDVLIQSYTNQCDVEVIVIDDGSSDGTGQKASEWGSKNTLTLKVVRFRRNYGKSVALAAAFREAEGAVVITMDADLQDDPGEINNLVSKIEQGFDLVSGWKQIRNDPINKRWPSILFNWFTAKVAGVSLHDFNCGLKAYRLEVVKDLKLYGELHRYIPVLAAWQGYRISEIPVRHHPRKFGKSKFGLERYARGFLDLLTVLFLDRYRARPLHLFGGVGLIFFLLGVGIELYMTYLWLSGSGIGNRPLFFLGILMIMVGLQSFFTGLLGDMLASGSEILPKYSVSRSGTPADAKL